MPKNSSTNGSLGPYWLLRRSDQAVVAALVVVALVMMGLWWARQGGWAGQTVEVDRAKSRQAEFQVDLNQAEWPELAQLPGLGDTLARRIVESRGLDGPFLDNDELTRVRGIGPKTLERIRPYLRPLPGGADLAGGKPGPGNRL